MTGKTHPKKHPLTIETLEKDEELYRRMVESTHEGIWMADLNGITTFANPQMARILGCGIQELIGHSVYEFVFPEDRETVRQHFASYLKAGVGQDVEERLRRKDGAELWAWVAASVFRDERNQPIGFLGMFTDVTERRRVEAALSESQARLQLQISRMPIPYIVWDRDFRVTLWNPAAEKLFGYSEQEASGRHAYELIVPSEARHQVDAIWQRLLRGDATASSVNTNVTKHGKELVCEWFNTPLNAGNAAVTGVLSMVQDVTDRQKAQEALHINLQTLEARVQERTSELQLSNQALAESEEKYRRLFETISDAAAVFDLETRAFVEANAAASRLYGYTRQEFSRLEQKDITHDQGDIIQRIASGLGNSVPIRHHRRKNGTVFPAEISCSTFTLKGRQMVCLVIRDVTQRQQAQEAIARTRALEREIVAISEREQQRLGQDLHDDLCQQLAGICFLSERLAGNLSDAAGAVRAQAQEITRMLRRSMARTRELARGLAPMGIQGDRLADALRVLAADTEKVFQIHCRFNGVQPINGLDAAVEFHLYRIAQEAVSNAIRHGHARHIEIEFTTAEPEGMLILAVRDDGVGLRRKAGKGMGLRIMQYRAETLGGTLKIERQPKGGTAVTCAVPGRHADPVKEERK